jgi:hypothetical protein
LNRVEEENLVFRKAIDGVGALIWPRMAILIDL